MASELKVDKFTGVTTAGSIDVTGEGNSTTTNLQQGLAKAWVNFNGTGTIATRDSYNVSSLNDDGTGLYDVVLTSNMVNNDYSPTVSGAFNTADSSAETVPTSRRIDLVTSEFGLRSTKLDNSHAFADSELIYSTIHGDLA
tara:strand:+ start:339 stop:761 length:423 start_codon:yes stop_codon:yes gene_type:complete